MNYPIFMYEVEPPLTDDILEALAEDEDWGDYEEYLAGLFNSEVA